MAFQFLLIFLLSLLFLLFLLISPHKFPITSFLLSESDMVFCHMSIFGQLLFYFYLFSSYYSHDVP